MISRRISLTLAAIAGIGLAIGRGADAQVIVQTFTVPANSSLPINDNFTFNLFNSQLGSLGFIELQLSASITAEVDVINISNSPQTYSNATASVPITLTAPAGFTETATSVAGPESGTAAPGETELTGLPASASSNNNIPQIDWGSYVGVGTLTGNINASSTSGTYQGTGGNSVFFGGNATAGATITLTYFYIPTGFVPEPGTTTFLAAGVLGSLGMVLRRRKK
jgi:hypothetical protein